MDRGMGSKESIEPSRPHKIQLRPKALLRHVACRLLSWSWGGCVAVFIRHATAGWMAGLGYSHQRRTTTIDTLRSDRGARSSGLNGLEKCVTRWIPLCKGPNPRLCCLTARRRPQLLSPTGSRLEGSTGTQLKPEDVRITDREGARLSTLRCRRRSSSSLRWTTKAHTGFVRSTGLLYLRPEPRNRHRRQRRRSFRPPPVVGILEQMPARTLAPDHSAADGLGVKQGDVN